VRLPLGKEHLRPEDLVVAGVVAGNDDHIAADAQEPSHIAIEAQVAQVNQTFPLLLIIEDNDDLRKHMRGYLAAAYRLLESVDGEEGIRVARDSVPDIIISDVMMPKMDGFTVCRTLKTDEKTSHIPIILLTARAGSEHKMEGLETGADDYITKPFEARELLSRVRNLIEQRRRLREKFRREGFIQLREISVTSADERFLKRAMETVESHVPDRKFTTDEFARQMFMSRMQLHRKIRALTDLSPGEFVRRIRMEKAAQLLKCRSGTIAEIAFQVGYEDPSRFADAFRIQFGILPSEFMKQQSQKG